MKNIVAVLLLLVCIISSYLTYSADSIVVENLDLIKNNRVNQDVNIYSQPETLKVGDYIEPVTDKLFNQADVVNSTATCKDLDKDKKVIFNEMPYRAFCLNLKNGFIKQVSPLPSYIFSLKVVGKRLVITEIFDESDNSNIEAKIYLNPKAIFKIDENGEVEAQLRQKLAVNPNTLNSDVIKMMLLLEGSRSYDTWNQGSDWLGIGRAVIQTSFLGSENNQSASTPFEQYAKIALIDAYNSPVADQPRVKDNGESPTFWENLTTYLNGKYKTVGKVKRRILSAYYAEALLQHFSKEDIILRWSSETNFGIEMSEFVRKGKLSHQDQLKEWLIGIRAAAEAFFNQKTLESLKPIEVATLAIAPREPALLRILQKNPAKRTVSEQEKIAKRSERYLKRIRNALIVFADFLEKEGKAHEAETYRKEAEKIPTFSKPQSEYRIVKFFKDLLGFGSPTSELSDAEKIAKFEEFKKLLPSLRINEDDKMSSESLQIMERQALRDEVAKIIDNEKLSYTDIKKSKLTVVTSTNSNLQYSLANILENSSEKGKVVSIEQIQRYLSGRLSTKKNPFSFGLLVESYISDQNGRIIASVAMRYENDKIIPNRVYVNYPTYMGSTAKVFHNTAALDAGKISLDTIVCSSQSVSSNGYTFDENPTQDTCMTIGEGLKNSINWVQIIVRNMIGNEIANDYWQRITGQNIKFPEGFEKWTPFEKDRWFYEQIRGVNAEPVSKSVSDVLGMFTTMANEGVKTNPSFIQKLWLGKNLTEIELEQTKVFNPESVRQISALLQENGKKAFGVGDESPAVKTGSLANAYWNAVWSRNLLVVSRVVLMPPFDEDLEKQIVYLKDQIKKEKENILQNGAKITKLESELNQLVEEKNKKTERFLKTLSEKSNIKGNRIVAAKVIQPFNQKVVSLLYSKHKYLFSEPN